MPSSLKVRVLYIETDKLHIRKVGCEQMIVRNSPGVMPSISMKILLK